MDRVFDYPIQVGTGPGVVVVIRTVMQAGAFLLEHWPEERRTRRSYKLAIKAVAIALTGQAEPETCRQVFAMAIADLTPRVKRAAPKSRPIRLPKSLSALP